MKLYIASDHAGFELKQIVLNELNHLNLIDKGTYSLDSVDYPDYIRPVCELMENELDSKAIFICGSGQGVCMTANKYKYIRASLCWDKQLARMTRLHNDSNALCLPSRFISSKIAIECILEFIHTSFEGGRHQNRINKMIS